MPRLFRNKQKYLDGQLKKACQRNDIAKAAKLFDEGAHVTGWVWHEVLHMGFLDMAKLFLEKGIDPTDLLKQACECDSGTSVFGPLIEHGADVHYKNSSQNTLLHVAAINKEIGMVTKLLEAGVDPHAKNNDGQTAAEYARISGGYDYYAIADQIDKLVKERSPDNKPGWHHTGASEASLIEEKSALNLRVTDIFNFDAGTHIRLASSFDSNAPGALETHALDVCPDKALLEEARRQLPAKPKSPPTL